MRSVLSKVQLSALALGLVVGGVVACGDDPAPANNGNEFPAGDGDGNTGGDGDGTGDGDSTGQPQCTGFGQACTTADGQSGFQACTSGVPSECMVVNIELPDSGVPDSYDDAGQVVSGVCPSPYTCDTLGGAIGQLLAADLVNALGTLCLEGGIAPPACTSNTDCDGFGLGQTCVANPASGVAGGAMICMSKCTK